MAEEIPFCNVKIMRVCIFSIELSVVKMVTYLW